MWKVGQKLICIESDWDYDVQPVRVIAAPIKGKIYTFDGVKHDEFIFLSEFHQTTPGGIRIGWDRAAFKPLEYSGNAISEILEKFKPEECRPDVEVIPEKLISNH